MNKIKIYHQCGHNTIWNLESYLQDKVGDGMIFSPSDLDKNKLQSMEDEIKEKSVFDPQYYLPKSNKKKFQSYDFFPNTIMNNEYSTENYEEKAYENAFKCVEFQNNNKFEAIIIPCVYKENFTESYLAIQKELYVIPFLNAIDKSSTSKPVFLTLIIKDCFLLDEEVKSALLTFATSFQNIDGIYIIPEHVETYKRVRDEKYLFELMKFIDKLRENDLLVHLGYTDIEGFIISLADVTSVSIGAYENTRCFSIEKFKKSEGVRQGPNPRIFSKKLLQNVEYTYLAPLEALYTKYNELFNENKYSLKLFEPTFQWHFAKPEIYKNYFYEYSCLLQELPETYEERYKFILEKIKDSMIYYKEINDCGVLLDEKSDGSHLTHWANAINMFNRYKINK